MPTCLWSTVVSQVIAVVIVVAGASRPALAEGGPRKARPGSGSAVIPRGPSDHLRLIRYAATARAWASVRPSGGILAPGLRAGGFLSHAVTASTVFGSMPAASVRRLPKVVRSGPRAPVDTPRIVWHPTHALPEKIAFPPAASPDGSPGAPRCPANHRSNASGASTLTRLPLLACEVPQNSAHWPRYSPAVSAVKGSRVRRPRAPSRLPPGCGTQKL